jgi:multidrug efflux system outer membrane protein
MELDMTETLFPHLRGRTSSRTLPFAATLLAVALAGCVTVTQPQPPKLDLPEGPLATAEQNALLERWWVAFDDPVLTALIEEAFANNLDLRAALARIEAARADVLLAQSYLYPSVNGRAGASRSRQSQSTAAAAGFAIPASNDYSLGVEMSYELDIWGKYRSGALAAANDLSASRYDRQAVRISVAAEVANAYFRLRAADALLVVFEDTRKSRADTVQLQQDRFDGGIIGEYDLRQAQAELSAVVADIARTRQAIQNLESAIATLTGRSPREVFIRWSHAARRSKRRPRCPACRKACRPACSSGARTSVASSICWRLPTCASRRHGPTISRA